MWSVLQIILSSLFTLALPTVSATPSGCCTNVNQQVDHEVSEGSRDTINPKTSSWTTIFSPSHLIDYLKNAYLPSAPRMMGAIQALAAPNPSTPDFWEKAKEYEKILQDYVPHVLESAASYFKSTKFTNVASAMNHIVNATAAFRDSITGSLDAHNVTLDALSREIEGMFVTIMNDLEKIPPPNKAPGHAEREVMADKILDDTTRELLKLATRYGIEEQAATYLVALKPQVRALVVAVGDTNEQHPQLLPMLVFSVTALLIPESWILRPFLSLFGFGPSGPVKGSVAAWLQRRFWGAAVGAGSWFALLQAAGMGVIPTWARFAIKVPLVVGGILAGLLPYFGRG